MINLNNYIIEKLHINKDTNKHSKHKRYDNIYDFDVEVIRPALEESGYYYGSDYETDVSKDQDKLDIYIIQDEKWDAKKLEWLLNDVSNLLDEYDIHWIETSIDYDSKPQVIHFYIKL